MLKDRKAVFLGLDHKEEYFPMVARIDSQAFFAMPPAAISPRGPRLALTDRVPTNNLIAPLNHSSYDNTVDDEGFEGFDGSSGDESDADSDEPVERRSERGSTGTGKGEVRRVNRTLWPRTDRLAWLPLTRSDRDRASPPVRDFYPYERARLTNSGNPGRQ